MAEEKSLDVAGLGRVARAIPQKAWIRIVETACTTFESFLAPLTELTGGVGRLVRAKFDRLTDAEKVLAAATAEAAMGKIRKTKAKPNTGARPAIIAAVLEKSAQETDPDIRELWANLLAREATEAMVHPQIVDVLAQLTRDDAQLLAQIEESSKTLTVAKLLKKQFVGPKRTKTTFPHTVLERLGLVRKFEGDWILTPFGRGFVRQVAAPKAG